MSVPCPHGGLLVDQGEPISDMVDPPTPLDQAVGGNRRDPSPTCFPGFSGWNVFFEQMDLQKKTAVIIR